MAVLVSIKQENQKQNKMIFTSECKIMKYYEVNVIPKAFTENK